MKSKHCYHPLHHGTAIIPGCLREVFALTLLRNIVSTNVPSFATRGTLVSDQILVSRTQLFVVKLGYILASQVRKQDYGLRGFDSQSKKLFCISSSRFRLNLRESFCIQVFIY